MNLAVTGGPAFSDYPMVEAALNKITLKAGKVVVLTQHRPGAERLAERWAWEYGLCYRLFPGEVGEMLREAEVVVVLGAATDRDTWGVVAAAKKKGIPVLTIPGE